MTCQRVHYVTMYVFTNIVKGKKIGVSEYFMSLYAFFKFIIVSVLLLLFQNRFQFVRVVLWIYC